MPIYSWLTDGEIDREEEIEEEEYPSIFDLMGEE